MTETLGEVREAMARNCWNQAEHIANELRKELKPFYIIYSAKVDPALSGATVNGQKAEGGIRQHFMVSYDRPPFVLGMLVWFVNNPLGIFEFVSSLSSPPDIPLDESMLSSRSSDSFDTLGEKAKKMNEVIPLVS